MLIQLTYASRPSLTFKNEEMDDILTASKRNNTRVGVTGALLYANGIFLQQLEGDRTEVNRLYHRILKDPRHRDPVILSFAEINSRRFTSWAMGSLAPLEANRHIYLKYSSSSSFDPYSMSAATLQDFFVEVLKDGKWVD